MIKPRTKTNHHTFSPDYHSRNQTPIVYDPAAQCPRFRGELLEPMLPQDDIEILQRYCGQCLLGVNITQTFLVLTGTAGGGKGTIINLIRLIIGEDNCVEMRTEHLGERFELARFIGKTFLTGSDVPSDFLQKKGAGKIKSLCGWDLLCAEIKGVTEPIPMIGNFNMVITANSRLKVNVDGDIDAWRRRMLWITFEKPRPANPIPDFAGVLLCEEGPGILNWMIEGAVKLLQDGFPSDSLSSKRVERLLQESNSIYGFLTTCVEKTDFKANITADELVSKYNNWCLTNDWEPFVGLTGRRKLIKGLETLFHVTLVHSIDREGDQRGFNGVRFKEPDNQ
jgi:P4 family phage/plasmid primase-like protien